MARRPRKKNVVDTQRLNISTTVEVVRVLQSLAKTGYFGKTATDVAKIFVDEKVREHIERGWLARSSKGGRR